MKLAFSIWLLTVVPLFVLVPTVWSLAATAAPPDSASSSCVDPDHTVWDVLVVGGGSAGLTAAKLASDTLQAPRVALIEASKLGGDCTWTGCVPSKALLAAAKAHHGAKKYGLVSKTNKADLQAIRETIRNEIIDEIYQKDDSKQALAKMGVQVLEGSAVLTASNQIAVTDAQNQTVTHTAVEGIVLCTGAAAVLPDIPGLQEVSYCTYETVWDLQQVPNRLTVVGGGPVGCELAQAFARLGAQVTMIADTLLPQVDSEARVVLQKVLEEEGIVFKRGKLVSVAPSRSEHIATYQATDSDETLTVAGDMLLVAVGRAPRVENMGLEQVGVQADAAKGIQVNSKLETSVKGIYAAGDCTGDQQFTHYAGYQGAIAARNILLPFTDPGVLETVPSTIFTSPEVASIGLSHKQAIETYGAEKVAVASKELSDVDRAVCEGATDGFIKILYLKKSGKILGATIVAPVAGDMICQIAVMMEANMPLDKLAKVMHPYPTYAFALQLIAADLYYEKTMRLKPIYDFLKRLGL